MNLKVQRERKMVSWQTQWHSYDNKLIATIPLGADSSEDKLEPQYVRQPIMELGGHSGVVIAADWLAAGNQVITASWDRTALLHDAEKGDIVTHLTGEYCWWSWSAWARCKWHVCCRAWPRANQRVCPPHTTSCGHLFQGHDLQALGLPWPQHEGQRLPRSHPVGVSPHVWCWLLSPGVSVAYLQAGDYHCVWWGRQGGVGEWWPHCQGVGLEEHALSTDNYPHWFGCQQVLPVRAAFCTHTVTIWGEFCRLAVSSWGVIAIPHDNRHIRLYDLQGVRQARLPRSNRTVSYHLLSIVLVEYQLMSSLVISGSQSHGMFHCLEQQGKCQLYPVFLWLWQTRLWLECEQRPQGVAPPGGVDSSGYMSMIYGGLSHFCSWTCYILLNGRYMMRLSAHISLAHFQWRWSTVCHCTVIVAVNHFSRKL